MPVYLRDRGSGIPLSQFGTYVGKGELKIDEEEVEAGIIDAKLKKADEDMSGIPPQLKESRRIIHSRGSE